MASNTTDKTSRPRASATLLYPVAKGSSLCSSTEDLIAKIKAKDGNEKEFVQAAVEVLHSLDTVFKRDQKYVDVMERLIEPERIISFRVPWVDDNRKQHVNRGFRVQFNSAIGPYKGGLRFHPTVNQSVLKFLAFEQVFKNSLTTLPMGGGKGGSDFDPKGKSDREIFHFCQSFMTELKNHIGPQIDSPAGDIGVGSREVGYLYGTYKRQMNVGGEQAVITGKNREWGGSAIRPEATGYGTVFFAQLMSERLDGIPLAGQKVAVSGAGNVAQYAAEKLIELKAIPVTLSDSRGCIYAPKGISTKLLNTVMRLKNQARGPLSALKLPEGVTYHAGKKSWEVVERIDAAIPCATQNEVNAQEAQLLISKGCKLIAEGANMPSTNEAIDVYVKHGILYGPGKAANAGGVAVSGLEMAQNQSFNPWSRQEVEARLKAIMTDIFEKSTATAQEYGFSKRSLMEGANIAGFLKVANSMIAHGDY